MKEARMSHVPVDRLAGKAARMAGALRGIGAAIIERMAAEGTSIANAVVSRIPAALAAMAVTQSSRAQRRSPLAIECSRISRFNVSPLRLCAISSAIIAFNAPAFAAEPTWKDGMLFTQEDLTSLQGHKAVKIVFGLEPGKCTGELTAVSEWLKMTQGTLVQTYPGRGDVQRVAGDEWFQENGTKVILCNKSGANAVLIGVQFKPE
jgi:hypothetical protein